MERISTGITCSTFCHRLLRCSYFKEKENYVKGARLLFERFLKKYDSNSSLFEQFAEEFNSRSYTGIRRIYTDDKAFFKDFCIRCAINFDILFSKYKITNIMEEYNWRWKIKGRIGGILHSKKDYNLFFSYKNVSFTRKSVDIACINNYIYNEATGKSNDALIMSVPYNGFYLVPYNNSDYTIQRGFATFTKSNKLRRRGEHCEECENNCKPLYLNGIERMESIL